MLAGDTPPVGARAYRRFARHNQRWPQRRYLL